MVALSLRRCDGQCRVLPGYCICAATAADILNFLMVYQCPLCEALSEFICVRSLIFLGLNEHWGETSLAKKKFSSDSGEGEVGVINISFVTFYWAFLLQ
ncbi:hypothetical protein JZ751_004188 [Albula glossodonta]|uniref:Uncharacterized protein n=1 Tax=Albula glossodonta TaxID=121402 RepID=A0A8T2N5S1_9TELE|nr:hypothetical protein JZ751_004188 [Albula glossodonta]